MGWIIVVGNGLPVELALISEEAFEADILAVTEVNESGSVPELLAENRSEKMVLLLDGEPVY